MVRFLLIGDSDVDHDIHKLGLLSIATRNYELARPKIPAHFCQNPDPISTFWHHGWSDGPNHLIFDFILIIMFCTSIGWMIRVYFE